MTGAINAEAIQQFVMANRLPLVTEFTQESASKIFGGDVKNHMLLFVRKTADDFQSHFDTFKEVAPNFKGKVRRGPYPTLINYLIVNAYNVV